VCIGQYGVDASGTNIQYCLSETTCKSKIVTSPRIRIWAGVRRLLKSMKVPNSSVLARKPADCERSLRVRAIE
jgi:hypothetical protein